jgi:hypothetical protein
VGGTPALVAGILLAEYLALAVIAAAAGLVVGRLAALTSIPARLGARLSVAETLRADGA